MAQKQRKQALDDVKVLDFTWSAVGPLATKYLCDHGATVVKVESRQRVDVARTYYPMKDNKPGINRCGWFDQYATGKYSVGLNLNHPRGIELAKRAVAWADVVVETFSPGSMEKWGLSYQDLVKVKPDIIMLSSTLLGQTGPYSRQSGFGLQMQAYAGFTQIVGWPDRPPTGNSCPYTDGVAPWYVLIAILTALDERRRTGRGQYIDLSQYESGVTFLAAPLLDCATNGRDVIAMGNRSRYAAPHGVYRCKGDDRWCAIAVATDEEWLAFGKVIGNPEWVKAPAFATPLARKENEDELDKLVETWTIGYPAEEVMLKMHQAGVSAGLVENARDMLEDPQFKHRRHFCYLDHPEMGVHAYEQPSCRLSRTPAKLCRSPLFAEHSEYFFTKVLGLPDEEFIELLAAGVIET